MKSTDLPDPSSIIAQFAIPGTLMTLMPYGSGHINRTFLSVFSQAGTRVRYIHQRINDQVFQRPDQLMDNIQRVLAHQTQKIRDCGLPDPDRRSMTLVPSKEGLPFARDELGGWWRTYLFIERTIAYDVLESSRQAREVSKAVGKFQRHLSDFPAPRLHETIPRFHHAGTRYQRFRDVLEEDRCQRSESVREEIDWFLVQERAASVISRGLESGQLPERITHNDTKANNILIDEVSGEGICVIDLDTVMPGSLLYDFGDLVRTCTATIAEDAPSPSLMEMDLPLFEGLVEGFYDQTWGVLVEAEKQLLPVAGRVLTTIIGLRFLTDYLDGDRYFRTSRPNHNLDRARTQIALVRSMDRQMAQMRDFCTETTQALSKTRA